MINKNTRIIVIGLAIILLVSLVGWLYYRFFVFHVLSISPSASNFPSSSRVIEFEFNEELAKDVSEEQIEIKPELRFESRVEESVLKIRLRSNIETDDYFTVSLKGIKASDGDTYNGSHTFAVQTVAFEDLSKEEQERQVEESDSFESSYPLTSDLPITNLNYSIRYEYPDSGETRMPIVISMNFGPESSRDDGTITAVDMEQYRQKIRTYRSEAISLLKSKGYDEERYYLLFGENELLQEFNGRYINERNGG